MKNKHILYKINRKAIINKLESELETKDKDICIQYICARNQRITELKNGLDLSGTMGYEVIGCYQCNGHRIKCGAYISLIKI